MTDAGLMCGVPANFADELHDLIADWLDKGMTFDEIVDDMDYMLGEISLHKAASPSPAGSDGGERKGVRDE